MKWKLVPVEPTEAMVRAGGHANSEWLNDSAPLRERFYDLPAKSVWKDMLDAAPAPVTVTDEMVERALRACEHKSFGAAIVHPDWMRAALKAALEG